MASLNTSTNGPSISASYQKIVNSPAPSGGAAAKSPTYGQWALFTVQAPLVSTFQQDSSKESVLKVQTTGEGELQDLIEDFSDGRIQFGYVKVSHTATYTTDVTSGKKMLLHYRWSTSAVGALQESSFAPNYSRVVY